MIAWPRLRVQVWLQITRGLLFVGIKFRQMMVAKKTSMQARPVLKGWREIAAYLAQSVATAQRWAKSGMPVARSGRYVIAEPDELNRWVGRESGASAPVHISHAGDADLLSELKRGLREARGNAKHRA